jgi:hypothetical protein
MSPVIAYRLYRFYRRCGLRRLPAAKKAFINTLKP